MWGLQQRGRSHATRMQVNIHTALHNEVLRIFHILADAHLATYSLGRGQGSICTRAQLTRPLNPGDLAAFTALIYLKMCTANTQLKVTFYKP
jgi:hypothetical protein